MPTSRDLATTNWDFHGTNDGSIAAGAACVTAQSLLRVEAALARSEALLRTQNSLLDSILSQMVALGADGLHQVIRHHRRVVRAKNAKTRQPKRGRDATT